MRSPSVFLLLVVAAACGPDEGLSPPTGDAALADGAIDAPPTATMLDPTFGTDGMVTLGDGAALAVLADELGGVLVCGRRSAGGGRLIRLDHDGALDLAFGTGGQVLFTQPCVDLARLADGRLAAVSTDAVRLLTAGGALVQEVHPPAPSPPLTGPFLYGIAPLDDGGFALELAVDRPLPMSNIHITVVMVARHDAAGAPVTSFGTDGRTTVAELQPAFPVQAGITFVRGPTPRLVAFFYGRSWGVDLATGAAEPTWDHDTFQETFGRFGNPTAALDAAHALVAGFSWQTNAALIVDSWNAGGSVRSPVPFCQPHPDAFPAAVAVDHQGRPVIASRYGGDLDELVVTRLRPDLSGIDPAWGCERHVPFPPDCAGACSSNPEARKGYATDVAIAADDAIIVVGGRRRSFASGSWFVARFTP